jgi:hypothetical protein
MRIVLSTLAVLVTFAAPSWSQCGDAAASSRNGGGANPTNLSANHAPILSTSFIMTLDCTGVVPPQNGFALLQGRLSTTAGVKTRAGELLINLSSPRLFRQIETGTSGITMIARVDIPPNDPSLCGLPISFQGLCGGGGMLQLSNAIDTRLGL